MPRALLVFRSLTLALALGLFAFPAFAASAGGATRTELVAANPGGDSTLIAVINYQDLAGGTFRERLAAFAKQNPDIRIVVRPTSGVGPLAEFLAKAAYAAQRQGNFSSFHDAVLAAPQAHTYYSLRDHAPAIGLDWAKFQRDFQEPQIAEQVAANAAFMKENNITVTPAFVARGKVFAGPLEQLDLPAVAAAARAGAAN